MPYIRQDLGMRATRGRFLLSMAAGAILVTACGSGDDDDAVADAASATTGAPAASGGSAHATGDAFPVTIEHKYGKTVIPAEPQRVVTVGFSDQDALLALGVVPVGIRDWYGDQPDATWPWAHDRLDGAKPAVLSSSELNFEQIRGLEPDLIIGLTSGMTEQEHATLSQIAPTVAQSDDHIEYGVPWQEVTRVTGQAVGKAAEADALVADVESRLAEVAAAHPAWKGQEAAVGYVLSDTEIGAYASADARPQLLAALGLVTPKEFDELAGDAFYSSFSFEEMGRLDRDVLVWIFGDPAVIERIKANPLRQQLTAVTEGREVFLGQLEAGAFSFSSPLSIPYLLDVIVPQLDAALDGNPATAVPDAA
jgi:iron complex transport system substrate-binding protein